MCCPLYYLRYLFIYLISAHFQASSLSSKITYQDISYLVIVKNSEEFLEDPFEKKFKPRAIPQQLESPDLCNPHVHSNRTQLCHGHTRPKAFPPLNLPRLLESWLPSQN